MEIVRYAGRAVVSEGSPRMVFLHGFPSVQSKQNREIAAGVVNELGDSADLLLYSGLGFAPGVFSFSSCLEEVTGYFEKLVQNSDHKIDLVGHSWGGFLALFLASRHPSRIRRLVLMSPLLWFATEAEVDEGFEELTKGHAHLSLPPADELVRDFCSVGARYSTRQLIEKMSPETEVLFLQARVDPFTPAEIAQQMKEFFPRAPLFELVDNDHSFLSERPRLALRIARFIKEGH